MQHNPPPTLVKHPDIQTVLVIGPRGNVGRHLIPKLLELGYRVRALQFNSEVPAGEGVEVVHGNTLDKESLVRAVRGVEAVCHMVRGGIGPGEGACEKWFNGCVRGAVNLLEAAKDVPLVRFLAGSADNVFGHVTIPHDGPLHENSPKRFADGYYGLFKIAEEAICRQYRLGFGVPVVVTRFPLIWTADRLDDVSGALDLSRQRIRRKIDCTGKPLVRHDAVIDDVVQGLCLALQHDLAVGEDFNFVGPAPYSSDRLAAVLRRHYDWEVEDQPMDWHSWTMTSAKAESMLGYRAQHNVLDWLDARLDAVV